MTLSAITAMLQSRTELVLNQAHVLAATGVIGLGNAKLTRGKMTKKSTREEHTQLPESCCSLQQFRVL